MVSGRGPIGDDLTGTFIEAPVADQTRGARVHAVCGDRGDLGIPQGPAPHGGLVYQAGEEPHGWLDAARRRSDGAERTANRHHLTVVGRGDTSTLAARTPHSVNEDGEVAASVAACRDVMPGTVGDKRVGSIACPARHTAVGRIAHVVLARVLQHDLERAVREHVELPAQIQ